MNGGAATTETTTLPAAAKATTSAAAKATTSTATMETPPPPLRLQSSSPSEAYFADGTAPGLIPSDTASARCCDAAASANTSRSRNAQTADKAASGIGYRHR